VAISQSELLEDILALERETAETVGAERSKAARWLEETVRAIDSAAEAERARLNEVAAQDEASAEKSAAEKAAGIVEQAKSLATRIEGLDDARLRPIVSKQIAPIVPGPKP